MDSTRKFTGKAGGYAKYRPQYPQAYIDYLISANSLGPGSVVADVGSGTGILSGQLLTRGLAVLAVEPNGDMRREAERALRPFPAFTSVAGAAEATTLPDACADLVTAAQAFHWFDRERFRAECRRILKPGGKVALVWNSRDVSSNLVQENERINRAVCPKFFGFGGGMDNSQEAFSQFFQAGVYESVVFRNDLVYGLNEFLGRNLSGSYAPVKGEDNYDRYVSELGKLFDRYSEKGRIVLPQVTRSYLGHV